MKLEWIVRTITSSCGCSARELLVRGELVHSSGTTCPECMATVDLTTRNAQLDIFPLDNGKIAYEPRKH